MKNKTFKVLAPDQVAALTPEARDAYYADLHEYATEAAATAAKLEEKNKNLSDLNKQLTEEVSLGVNSVNGKRPVVTIDKQRYEVVGKVHQIKIGKGAEAKDYGRMQVDDILKNKDLCRALIERKSGIFKLVED